MNRHKCNHIIFTEKSTESNLDRELIDIVKNNAEEFLGKGSFIFKENPSIDL